MTIYGTPGDDTLTGTGGDDFFNLAQGGNDTASGLGGNDTFWFGAAFTSADKIDGGSGSDTLALDGDYTGSRSVTFAADTMVNVEAIFVAGGHSYDLVTNDANVASGAVLLVNGTALGVNDVLVFDGSAETNGQFHLAGGAGDDILTGGAKDDYFNLDLGGNDTANGGNGNDRFILGATFTAADKIDGGLGKDIVVLDGDYTGIHALAFGATTMVGVETLRLVGGHSYSIVTNDATVAAGQVLLVNCSGLGADETLTFDGSAELNGAFRIGGGAGDDVIIGGSKDDRINLSFGGDDTVHGGAGDDLVLMGAALTAADSIDGGTGFDAVELNGDYTGVHAVVFSTSTMTNFEGIILESGHSYDLTTTDATVAPGAQFFVGGQFLFGLEGGSVKFDGSAELDGTFQFVDGDGNDTFIGGAGNDRFDFKYGGNDTGYGGGGNDYFDMGPYFTSSDRIDGGSGYNDMDIYGNYTGANALHFTATTMTNIQYLYCGGDGYYDNYDITTVDATVASGATLIVIAGGLPDYDTLMFDGSAETDGHFQIYGGNGHDVLIGGVADYFFGSGGGDTIRPGSGDNTFGYGAAYDSTSTGYDTINNLDFAHATFGVFKPVTAIESTINGGSLSTATFDTDLASATHSLGANHAVLFAPDSGTLAGQVFLVIDQNGVTGYQSGADLVIDVTGYSGTPTTSDFT